MAPGYFQKGNQCRYISVSPLTIVNGLHLVLKVLTFSVEIDSCLPI